MNYYVGAILTFVATTVALLLLIIPSFYDNNTTTTTSSLLLLRRGSAIVAQESPSTKSRYIAHHERHTTPLPPPRPLSSHSFVTDNNTNANDEGSSSELVVQAARTLLRDITPPPASIITTTASATTGVRNNLVILVRFADHTNRILPSQADIYRLYNSISSTSTPPLDTTTIIPTGSVKQYYQLTSYNKLTIQTVVSDWITLSKPEYYYAAGSSSSSKSSNDPNNNVKKFKEGILEALDKLDKSGFFINNPLLFNNNSSSSSSNSSSNKNVDSPLLLFGILHSGYDAAYNKNDCMTGAPPNERIWSHKGGLTTSSAGTSSSSGSSSGGASWKPSSTTTNSTTTIQTTIQRYYTSSALRGTCNSDIVRIGVLVHEIGHFLGLSDLYDDTFIGGTGGLGSYDVMSSAWGVDGSGMYPPSLCAYNKIHLQWAQISNILHDGIYTIESSTSSNVVYKIDAGYPVGEYILIENRQRTGYDSLLYGVGGIAIYHIDEKAMNAQNVRGYPNMPSSPSTQYSSSSSSSTNTNNKVAATAAVVPWPQNGKHYMIALLPSDGQYDLERGINMGDATDLWHSNSIRKELRSGLLAPHPNTNSYQHGSDVTPTGLRIYDFSTSGKYMTFKVDGLGGGGGPMLLPSNNNSVVVDIATTTTTTTTTIAIPNDISKPDTTTTVVAVPKLPVAVSSNSSSKKPIVTNQSSSPPPPSPPLPVTSVTTGLQQHQQEKQQMCTKGKDLCLKEILTENCPQLQSSTNRLASCVTVNIGELCIGSCSSSSSSSSSSGEEISRQVLNNCPQLSFDVYIRIDCNIV